MLRGELQNDRGFRYQGSQLPPSAAARALQRATRPPPTRPRPPAVSLDHLVGAGRSVGGISIPSSLAVLRFSTRSNLAVCSTGRSAGFAPLRIFSTYSAARRKFARRSGP